MPAPVAAGSIDNRPSVEPSGRERQGGTVTRWRPGRRARRWTVAGLAGLVLLAAVPVGWAVHYRLTYRTFAWWRPPQVFHYCGLDHFADGTTTVAEIKRDYPGFLIRPRSPCRRTAGWPTPWKSPAPAPGASPAPGCPAVAAASRWSTCPSARAGYSSTSTPDRDRPPPRGLRRARPPLSPGLR
ncbi:hypothetical protein GXW82_15575 [Streptacidiphilus sp. 4-A2]|nr:hypothetical protein [Streptacidiphilus sp. 4-A2]